MTDSLLLRLPPELRNIIYSLILQHDEPFKIMRTQDLYRIYSDSKESRRLHKKKWFRQARTNVLRLKHRPTPAILTSLALTATCKAIRAEVRVSPDPQNPGRHTKHLPNQPEQPQTLPIFYSSNRFTFTWTSYRNEHARLADMTAFQKLISRTIKPTRLQNVTLLLQDGCHIPHLSATDSEIIDTVQQVRCHAQASSMLSFQIAADLCCCGGAGAKPMLLDMGDFEASCVRECERLRLVCSMEDHMCSLRGAMRQLEYCLWKYRD
ncbi:hypothetical protein EJ03DRAFT_356005 [Teratosphaeria nubilosa]|uniref:Uncharacterized protein n=1 Tax=Teratosphaeria nubilosa TaxID=161662 RepID=A0A6G1KU95_9PEZI|nr:hypothetical protein EJ03DRAFT_356005 [Teratosphaeria nubilosa]